VRTPSADWKTIEPPNPLLAPGKYCSRVSKPAVLSDAGDRRAGDVDADEGHHPGDDDEPVTLVAPACE
jgi:hypothetical protein